MKIKVKIIVITLLFSSLIRAQISIQFTFGQQPDWGPIGYENVNYYYLPEIEVYYDIHSAQFIYLHNGIWIRSRYLPQRYRFYDLYRGYKVVLNIPRNRNPYSNFYFHRIQYKNIPSGTPQKNIRDYKKSHIERGRGKKNNRGNRNNGNR